MSTLAGSSSLKNRYGAQTKKFYMQNRLPAVYAWVRDTFSRPIREMYPVDPAFDTLFIEPARYRVGFFVV